jgi:hypothetical protein
MGGVAAASVRAASGVGVSARSSVVASEMCDFCFVNLKSNSYDEICDFCAKLNSCVVIAKSNSHVLFFL